MEQSSIMDQELVKWIDNNVSIEDTSPPKLKEGTPEEIRKKFEKWQRRKAEDEALGIWR